LQAGSPLKISGYINYQGDSASPIYIMCIISKDDSPLGGNVLNEKASGVWAYNKYTLPGGVTKEDTPTQIPFDIQIDTSSPVFTNTDGEKFNVYVQASYPGGLLGIGDWWTDLVPDQNEFEQYLTVNGVSTGGGGTSNFSAGTFVQDLPTTIKAGQPYTVKGYINYQGLAASPIYVMCIISKDDSPLGGNVINENASGVWAYNKYTLPGGLPQESKLTQIPFSIPISTDNPKFKAADGDKFNVFVQVSYPGGLLGIGDWWTELVNEQNQFEQYLTVTVAEGGTVTMAQSSIPQGYNVKFTYSGFQPNTTVKVTIVETGGNFTFNTDSTGGGSYYFTDHDALGNYTLKLTDSDGHSAQATFAITAGEVDVTPTLQISPTAIAQGGNVNYTFWDFQPDQPVYIVIVENGSGFTGTAGGVKVAIKSAFTDNDPPGNYTLKVTDDYGHSAQASFQIVAVNPTLTATPNSVPQGNNNITFKCAGCTPNGSVTLSIGSWSEPLTMDNSGGYSIPVSIQKLAPGNYTAVCLDNASGKSASANFTITSVANPTLTATPSSVTQGNNNITFTGSGYTPNNSSVTLSIGSWSETLLSDASGKISATVSMQNLSSGTYTATCVDNASSKSASVSFTITAVTPPPSQKKYLTVKGSGYYIDAELTYPNMDTPGAQDQLVVIATNKYTSAIYIRVVMYVSGTAIYDHNWSVSPGASNKMVNTANFTMPSGVQSAGVTAMIYYWGTDWAEDVALTGSISKM
jgi:hypothetical protein